MDVFGIFNQPNMVRDSMFHCNNKVGGPPSKASNWIIRSRDLITFTLLLHVSCLRAVSLSVFGFVKGIIENILSFSCNHFVTKKASSRSFGWSGMLDRILKISLDYCIVDAKEINM